MTLILRNMQRLVALNRGLLEADINLLRSIMRVEQYDLAVVFVTPRKMKSVNRDYRGKDEPTDILSFPFHSDIHVPGSLGAVEHEEELCLGDLLLCPSFICSKYGKADHELRTTLVPLITHGLMHLLGHTHETEDRWLLMKDREQSVLKQWGLRQKKELSLLYDLPK